MVGLKQALAATAIYSIVEIFKTKEILKFVSEASKHWQKFMATINKYKSPGVMLKILQMVLTT